MRDTQVEQALRGLKEALGEPEVSEEVTKKHFVEIARILKAKSHESGVKDVAIELASYFSQENPRFDTDRFLKAAGVS